MADNSEGGNGSSSSNIAELRKQVITLVARKFEGTLEKPIDDVVSKVLNKRRKKWRKRHKLPAEVTSRPPDPYLRDEKEHLTDQFYQRGERLLVCRRSSYDLARQLEREKRKLQLQVAENYHQRITQQHLEPENNEPSTAVTNETAHESNSILKDLQMALSQAEALVKVKQMKLTMTPRLPPLHRRESEVEDAPNDQFGMSLLVPPQQVLQPSVSESGGGVDMNQTHPVLSKLLTSDMGTCVSTGLGQDEVVVLTKESNGTDIDIVSDADLDVAATVNKHMDLNPAAELSPVSREQEINTCDTDDPVGCCPDETPRVACVMSLMEGQDTASVVEVMAENDVVIETHSSLASDKPEVIHEENNFEEHFMSITLLPEKEEIVSTTPKCTDETNSYEMSSAANSNCIRATSPEQMSLRDTNCLTTEEELVEMIMKDSDFAAWIAKARLRPRTPINYTDVRRKRRQSRSRSSSIHD